MKKKITFLFLFFSCSIFAFELKESEIVIPDDLSGVVGFATDRKFKLKYKIFNSKIIIKPKNNLKNSTIEEFMQTLIFSYKNKSTKRFKSLISEADSSFIQEMDKRKIKGVMNLLSQAEMPYLKLIYEFNDGFVIWWSADNFVQERQVFLKKIKGQFYLSKFHADKDNHLFSNINSFFQFKIFEKYKAQAKQSKVTIKDSEIKSFDFFLSNAGSYLSLFKKGDDEAFVHVIDNYNSKNYRFSDENSKSKQVTLRFSGKNFKGAGKRKIYFIESSYPIGKLTAQHFKESSFFLVDKIDPQK